MKYTKSCKKTKKKNKLKKSMLIAILNDWEKSLAKIRKKSFGLNKKLSSHHKNNDCGCWSCFLPIREILFFSSINIVLWLKYCCEGVDFSKNLRLFDISCNTPDPYCPQYVILSIFIFMESVNHYVCIFDCSLFNSSLRSWMWKQT